MQPWMAEWKKFSDRSIERMKSYSDDTNEEREWMCYVYDVDGTYELGEPSYGTLSRIEVSPEKKSAEDQKKQGLKESQRKWTIHGHPLKDGKIYTGRQYFSSTDICREFVRCMNNDEYVVQFLVYPHKQVDTGTGKEVLHNRCRILVFPNRETVVRAMKDSNPHVDASQITPESGQNQSVKLEDGSTTLKNDLDIDWFAFQESLGRMGFMGIIDLEGPSKGAKVFNSENYRKPKTIAGFVVMALAGVYLLRQFTTKSTGFLSAEGIEVVDGFSADCIWHSE